MKVVINNPNRMLCYDNDFYDTNVPIEMDVEKAMRLNRVATITAEYPPPAEYDPKIWKAKREFTFVSDLDPYSGWGNVTFNLLKYSPEFYPSLVGKMYDINDSFILNARRKKVNLNGACVWHEQPRAWWLNTPFGRNVGIVPWETTQCPPSWVARINNMDALLVPCKQNIEAFKNSGVTVPIDLIHWGVDAKRFSYIDRTDKETFTFASMGALSERKGTDLLIRAFSDAFPLPHFRHVRLILKTSHRSFPFTVKDPRIKVMMSTLEHNDLIDEFFKKIDCFVFPTRGEGFGLPALESLALGFPTIATKWAGIAEFMTDEYGYCLDYKMKDAVDFTKIVYKEECGQWAEPDYDHLVQTMRDVLANRNAAKEKGKDAAEFVKKNWLWEHQISLYKDALNKYL
jgi:glycosyltransferase involved in cell wall biosynthesis